MIELVRRDVAAVARCAAVAAVFGACMAATNAHAGGFALREGSTNALGASMSGATSAANDISYTYWNPAALREVQEFAIYTSVSYIAPDSEGTFSLDGSTVSGAEDAVVPATYLAARLTQDIVIGVSISSPFGLATEYDPGELSSLGNPRRSALTLVQVAPMISYDILPNLTIGGGPTMVAGQLIFETDATSPGVPLAQRTNTELDVEGVAFGFQFGLLWSPAEGTNIGVSYHSGYNLRASGDAEISGAGVGGGTVTTFGLFSADLPALATFGVSQQLTPEWRIMGEVQWQQWSVLDTPQLEIGGTDAAGEPFNYEDSWLVALGAEYRPFQMLTLRTGVAWDQTPTIDADRSTRIPDEDRLWLSFGGSFQVTPSTRLDFSYSYLRTLEDAIANANGGTVDFGTQQVHIFSLGASANF